MLPAFLPGLSIQNISTIHPQSVFVWINECVDCRIYPQFGLLIFTGQCLIGLLLVEFVANDGFADVAESAFS